MFTDKQLVEGFRSGHGEMLGLLVDRYKDDLYRFCRHLTLNTQDAEDLFQEVWVRVIRKLEKYDCERTFKAWLFQVALNLHRDRYRRWRKIQLRFLGGDASRDDFLGIQDPAPLTEETLLRSERNAELEQGLRVLSKRYLAPLVLYYYNEFSYEEIAGMLGIPVGTVKSRLNQGKKLLHTAMQQHVKEEK